MDQLRQQPSRAEIRQLRGLTQRKNREAQGQFVAEGIRVVEDLLASPLTIHLVIASSSVEDTARGGQLLEMVERRNVPVRQVSEREMAEFAGTDTPQGIIAIAEQPRWTLDNLDRFPKNAVLLLLDAVQDPGNLGTLIRTAEALGAAGVVILPGTVDPWNPKAVRAAAGSSFRLPVIPVQWERIVPWLRNGGYRILAAAIDGEPLERHEGRSALVVGNEGAGISAETLAYADTIVGIPLRGRAESLNVGAAAAILLYELLR